MANVEKFPKEGILFGKKIKELRDSNGERQLDLAAILNYTTDKQVGRIESGTFPSVEKIYLISKHYKYDFFSLLGDIFRVKRSMPEKTTIADATPKTSIAAAAKILALQELIIEFFSDDKYKKRSEDEIRAALGSKVNEILNRKDEMDTLSGGDK